MGDPYKIQGQLLEVTVVGCTNLRSTEWLTRQDPYICLEYGASKFRTRTCKDGGKNPSFNERFVFTLVEGLREFNVAVWNSNSLSSDDLIATTTILLHKVLSEGFDDMSWPLQSFRGRSSGELRLVLHYRNAQKNESSGPYPPPYPTYPPSYPPNYAPYPSYPSYPPPSPLYPPPYSSQQPIVVLAPPTYSQPPSYPPQPYAPPSYPPPSPSHSDCYPGYHRCPSNHWH